MIYKFESGLDNSPMYDSPPVQFNNVTHHMLLWDVGLNGMLLMDCEALIDMANILNRTEDAQEISKRHDDLFKRFSQELWDPTNNCFLNKIPGQSFYKRVSPTNFYSMLGKVATNDQVSKMLDLYLTSKDWFCVSNDCTYSLPSISRNDPAFKDQNYWRGRIWAPMNMLTYLSLRRYKGISNVDQVRTKLCEQSKALLLHSWLLYGHIQENYSGITGEGCDVGNADPFYHWGALNGFLNLMEQGYIDGPENPIFKP